MTEDMDKTRAERDATSYVMLVLVCWCLRVDGNLQRHSAVSLR